MLEARKKTQSDCMESDIQAFRNPGNWKYGIRRNTYQPKRTEDDGRMKNRRAKNYTKREGAWGWNISDCLVWYRRSDAARSSKTLWDFGVSIIYVTPLSIQSNNQSFNLLSFISLWKVRLLWIEQIELELGACSSYYSTSPADRRLRIDDRRTHSGARPVIIVTNTYALPEKQPQQQRGRKIYRSLGTGDW